MKKRTFIFDTSEGAGESLSKVLSHYALAAYPQGGSDCAAASREALLNLVNRIQADDFCEINTRQRPILNVAVRWYFKESGIESDNDSSRSEFELLSMLLQKTR